MIVPVCMVQYKRPLPEYKNVFQVQMLMVHYLIIAIIGKKESNTLKMNSHWYMLLNARCRKRNHFVRLDSHYLTPYIVYTYTNTCIDACMSYVHTYIHTYIVICIHTFTHTYIGTCKAEQNDTVP